MAVNLPRKDPARVARLFMEAQALLGILSHDGSDTARTEGMPLMTARTLTADTEGGYPGESPLGRRSKMSMDLFLQSNPYVRQLLAEADCLGMREYIMGQVYPPSYSFSSSITLSYSPSVTYFSRTQPGGSVGSLSFTA